MPDFLLEIGCEEIPARMIDAARSELEQRLSELLRREGLSTNPAIQSFSTPRRLGFVASQISNKQLDVEEEVTGPAVKASFKDGEPTIAALKFAEKVGLPIEQIGRVTTSKGEYLSAQVRRKGQTASDILSDLLPKEIAGLYWAKSMYWRPGRTSERFVRPVRWLVAMLDGDSIPLQFSGIGASSQSRGHRTLGQTVSIKVSAEYEAELTKAAVIANPAMREATIRKALDAATRKVPGARWREDAALLNKVVNLTEWPSAILGNFDPQFLSLPEEVLVTVMRDHQNYFAVENASGTLAPHFLAILNTNGDPRGIICHGHERVLRARFNDARFFWDTDQKLPLGERIEMLKAVTFQKDLGSYYEKAQRVASLAGKLAGDLQAAGFDVDVDAVKQAALLCKTDLTTELVKEFTELQGIIGGLYARHQGLGEKTAAAIYDHYRPESMEDDTPRTIEGAVLSIADKADSIAGMFSLGLVPSGSKDPFALRRQANGIVRIIVEKELPVGLGDLFSISSDNFNWKDPSLKQTVFSAFFRERLEFYLRDTRGFAYDVVNAVLAAGADDVVDALARTTALAKVRGSEDFESIAPAFKRIKNILRQAHEAGSAIAPAIDAGAFVETAERELHQAMTRTAPEVNAFASRRQYTEGLTAIATLRPRVDAFFDQVMVMAEDARLRANRLALLRMLFDEFSTIADFGEIVIERK